MKLSGCPSWLFLLNIWRNMKQSQFFNFDRTEPQPKQFEEKSSFGYSCRPTTHKRTPFDRLGGI